MHVVTFELLWGIQLGPPRPVGPQGFLKGDQEAAKEALAKEEKLQVRVCAWHMNDCDTPVFKMQTQARKGGGGLLAPLALEELEGLHLKSCSGDSGYQSKVGHGGTVLGPRRLRKVQLQTDTER